MDLQWKSFKIDLDSFSLFLKQNIPNSDGIIAEETKFTVVEKNPFTENEKDLVTNYYNGLTAEGEALKSFNPLTFRIRLATITDEFIKENIMLGITQAGATREVADILKDIFYYLQAAPTEAIVEIDRLLAKPISFRCSPKAQPFLSDARLTLFKTKIINGLRG